jgi:2-polyprenyl-3-methyl-5-hydroxy-6-metoxy-1,4-benzoquinol methylase/GNAT superfamily N-acetyltransferase
MIEIRKAKQGDEKEIARVHIKAWQESYKGMIQQEYLDNLTSELDARIKMWTSILENPLRWAWVAESSKGIVGFILFGPPRDPGKETYIELGAIYLLASEKSKGIGFSLLSAGFSKMKDLGFKKAYCWVLESNPTIKFYERSGAKFSGQSKADEIGGKRFNELAFEWETLKFSNYNWQPISVNEVESIFTNFKFDWMIAGGWAIDLFLGKQTRTHDDIDILIRRDDQLELQILLSTWDLWAADPPGTLIPWVKGKFLKKGLQDIWGRKTPKDPWQIQIMLFDTENNDWIYKRNEQIRRSLSTVSMKTENGLPFLAPEIQLLYKSKSIRGKDQQDFENVLSYLSKDQLAWLKQSFIETYKDDHQWIAQLNSKEVDLSINSDEKTHSAYTENAGEYSRDWLSQAEPIDIYQLVQKFFIPNGTTADIGCGNGRDCAWMDRNGFRVSGFDSSEELLKLAHELYPQLPFRKATLPDLKNIKTQYDNVFCETVIMHLPKNQIDFAIQNLKRILKPGGILYLSWRVTEGEDNRHTDGRLYSAFDPDFITSQFQSADVLFFEDKISLSSKKRVCRLIWKNN